MSPSALIRPVRRWPVVSPPPSPCSGFYVLAIVLAAALLAVAIVPWIVGTGHNLWVTITAIVLAFTILSAIVPRRLRFHEPGLRITRDQPPRLLELVASEAEAAGEPLPDDVYLTLEPNAAVNQVARHRRVLIIGVPLLHILSERGLRGVLAPRRGDARHAARDGRGDPRTAGWVDDPEIYDREAFVAAGADRRRAHGAGGSGLDDRGGGAGRSRRRWRRRRGDGVLSPGLAVHGLATGRLTAAEWQAQVSELGVADLPLGVPAQSETPVA